MFVLEYKNGSVALILSGCKISRFQLILSC